MNSDKGLLIGWSFNDFLYVVAVGQSVGDADAFLVGSGIMASLFGFLKGSRHFLLILTAQDLICHGEKDLVLLLDMRSEQLHKVPRSF